MTAETAAAITMTAVFMSLLWLSSQDFLRKKHEAITLLFFFLGLLTMIVDVYTVSEFLRVEIDADLGSLWITVVMVLSLVFIFVLFYFILMVLVFWLKKMQRANQGFDNDE